MSSYNSLLRDARWQKKRLKIMERDGFECKECGCGENDGTMLTVHHAYYEKNKSPWEYPDESLKTLCMTCHEQIQEDQNKILSLLLGKSDEYREGLAEALVVFDDCITALCHLAKKDPGLMCFVDGHISGLIRSGVGMIENTKVCLVKETGGAA